MAETSAADVAIDLVRTPPELPTDENGETVEPGDFNGKGGFGGMMTPPDGDTPPFGDMQPPTEEAQ